MPRRSIFSSAERDNRLILPDNHDHLIRGYAIDEQDMSIIHQHRTVALDWLQNVDLRRRVQS